MIRVFFFFFQEYMSVEEPSSPLYDFMEREPNQVDLMDETIHRQTTWQLLTASFRDHSQLRQGASSTSAPVVHCKYRVPEKETRVPVKEKFEKSFFFYVFIIFLKEIKDYLKNKKSD